jgi:hypothetical protein
MPIPDAKHPIWKVAQGMVIASVLIFALSPYSGLYNSWTRSDIVTVLAVLASWAGLQIPFSKSQP